MLDSIFNRIIRNRGLKRNTWIYIDEIYLLFQHGVQCHLCSPSGSV